MSDLKFEFSEHKDLSKDFLAELDHIFATMPKEDALQNFGEVCVGILNREDTDIIRTKDILERCEKRARYREIFEEQGARLDELGCFKITVDYDEGDPEALDVAVQALVLTLSEWSYHTGTLVAFAIHAAEDDGEGGYSRVHIHVLWDRRRGEKLYRDNVLQWYLHEQFDKDARQGREPQ